MTMIIITQTVKIRTIYPQTSCCSFLLVFALQHILINEHVDKLAKEGAQDSKDSNLFEAQLFLHWGYHVQQWQQQQPDIENT